MYKSNSVTNNEIYSYIIFWLKRPFFIQYLFTFFFNVIQKLHKMRH